MSVRALDRRLRFRAALGLCLPRARGSRGFSQAQAARDRFDGLLGFLVTDNWTYRVITPPKGDYLYLPLNAEARSVADAWDPAKDEAAGEQCKGYGPVGVMRLPTRLHITWQDANTLKLETDTEPRLAYFTSAPPQPPAGPRTWQGYSAPIGRLPGGRGRGGQGDGRQSRHPESHDDSNAARLHSQERSPV